MPLVFVKELIDVVVEDETTAIFECEVNKPNISAHWNKNGTRIQQSEKYSFTVDGTRHRLEIKDCNKFDAGTIEVELEDVKSAASLVVEMVTVELTKPLENVVSEEMPKTVKFTCEFSKADLPAKWYKDGKLLESDKKYKMATTGTEYCLEIKNASAEDEGLYSTSVKGASTEASLKFLIRPSLKLAKKYEEVVVIKAGQSTVFEIPFAGYPEPTITWHYKGAELPKSRRVEVESRPGLTLLKIKQCERTDGGTYSCSASNEVCDVSADITLDVLDKPSPPENFTVTDTNEESVTLEWDKPTDDGGSEITHYIVEKKEVAKRSYTQVAKCVEHTATVDGLREGHKYLFQVSAVNDIGKSEPTELASAAVPTSKFGKLAINFLTNSRT